MKKLLAVILCLTIVMSLGLSAFASDGAEQAVEETAEKLVSEEPEQGSSEAPAEELTEEPAEEPEEENKPMQAVVIAIDAPATIKNLQNGERFDITGEDEAMAGEYGGALTLTNGDINAFVIKKWANYFKVSKTAQSKFDGSEVFVALFKMGTIVDVIERGESTSTVMVNGVEAEIENRFLLFPDQVPYVEWTGYTKVGAEVYDNPWLRGQPDKFPNKNTEYKVIADMINCYLINSGDYFGYIPKEHIMSAPKNWTVDEPASVGIGPEWTFEVN